MEGVELKTLKSGEYFTLKPYDEPRESQVYVKGYYEPSTKKYECFKFNDVNRYRYFSGKTIVYTDGTF